MDKEHTRREREIEGKEDTEMKWRRGGSDGGMEESRRAMGTDRARKASGKGGRREGWSKT